MALVWLPNCGRDGHETSMAETETLASLVKTGLNRKNTSTNRYHPSHENRISLVSYKTNTVTRLCILSHFAFV